MGQTQVGEAVYSPFELGLLVGRVEANGCPLAELVYRWGLEGVEANALADHATFSAVGMRRYAAWLRSSEEEE